MSKMKTLQDLLEHQLKDLYSAETQILDALPKMIDKASNSSLKKAFESHMEETKGQKQRLEQACKVLDIDPDGEKCKAIAGIISEAADFMKENAEPEVMDAGLIAQGQRVEHYEIAGYGTALHYAKKVGAQEVADLLAETLEQEKDADEKLNDLAIEKINDKAMA
ncbi:YciE/YciF ferroxidase family protein [Fulvivirga ligni]|uniref:YciE/YciF ferroxidase family protein n=1 Tax=Fulvivirga ligni TaxID=2904246 RepID=UPI001F195603|nr:ferritin-like domain-containing protein [Fulvivirga ligni]UII21151.1 ferritin-like domain-containing protein [Fulvivirga ligni]